MSKIISPLSPFIDDDEILRVGWRLQLSNLCYSEKNPILLPQKHHVTELIIREHHLKTMNSGVQGTLNSVENLR